MSHEGDGEDENGSSGHVLFVSDKYYVYYFYVDQSLLVQ